MAEPRQVAGGVRRPLPARRPRSLRHVPRRTRNQPRPRAADGRDRRLAGSRARMNAEDTRWIELALAEAQNAADNGEVPVGAVLVGPVPGNVLAFSRNKIVELHDPTAH